MLYSEMIMNSWSAARRVLFALAVFGIVGAIGCDSLTAPEVDRFEQVRADGGADHEEESRDDSGGDVPGGDAEQEAESGKRTETETNRPKRPIF